MSEALWLTDQEVADLTRRKQPFAQARELTRLKVPHQRRADGSLLVWRADTQQRTVGDPANGLNWSKRA